MSGPDPLARVAAATKARHSATAEWEAAIVEAVLGRLPLRQIAAAAGVSHPTVAAIAARHGVEIRGHPPTGYQVIQARKEGRNHHDP
ncbi:MAG UNVERIFIED_CONTAM: hypothetical protein LOD86_00100 [Thermobifida fusca]